MPRLSLYRPNRQNDYKFIDRTVMEMYQVGGHFPMERVVTQKTNRKRKSLGIARKLGHGT